MKRLLSISCLLTFAALFAAEPQNLVNNADFKQLSASGGPGGWYLRPGDAPIKRFTLDDGTFGLRFSGNRVFAIQNNVKVQKGGSYMLSIKFRGKPGTKARFYIEGGRVGKDYWTEAIHISCRSDQWVSAQHPFTAKGNAPHVVLAQLSDGEIEFAEPTVAPFTMQENRDGNLLRNAAFTFGGADGGVQGWELRPDTASVERTKLDDGSNGVKFSGNRVFLIQNNVRIRKGEGYMLSIKFRGQPGTKARFYVEGGSGKTYWTEAIHITCQDKWISAQHPFTASGNNPHVVMVQLSEGSVEFTEPRVIPFKLPKNKDGNLLRNAAFTFGGADGGVQGWTLRAGADDTVERFKRETGGNAVRLTGKRILLVQDGVKLRKGERYLLGVSFRGKPGTNGRFYVEGGSGKTYWTKAIHIKATNAEKWQTIQLPFTADGDNPHVVMALLSPGSLEFSEPKVVPAPKKKDDNLLINANFSMTLEQDGKIVPALWDAKNGAEIEIVRTDIGNAVRMQSLPKSRSHLMQSNLELQKGKEYQFSIRYRGTPGTVFLYGAEGDGWGNLNRNIKCQKEWRTASIRIRLPEKARGTPYAVIATEPKGGYVELADPKVIEVEPGFTNGDFKKGSKGWIFENAKVVDRDENTKCVRLDGTEKKARIIQSGLLLEKGKHYELSFDARGGNDRRFTDNQNATWYRVALYSGAEPTFGSGRWLDSFERWQHKSLRFTSLRDMSVDVVGELRDPGTVYFANITVKEIPSIAPPLDIVLDPPWIYTRGAVEGAKGSFSGSVFPSVKAAKLRITFDGKEQEIDYSPEMRFTLAIPSEPGRQKIKFELIDAAGKVVATDREHFTVRGKAPEYHSHVVTFDEQHRMFLDGKPFFAIGCWGNRGPISREESYYRLSDLGFNMVMCGGSSLDAVDAAGLYAMLGMNNGTIFKDIPEKDKLENVIQYAEGMKKTLAHPALVCYFSVDEPAWRGDQLGPYQSGYKLFRDHVDPWRPVFLNEAPRGTSEALRPSGAACDIYGIDIYPIPSPNNHSEIDDKTATSVGKYTDMCRVTVRDRKPVWMTLQGFAWGQLYQREEIYPTLEESRFMAYDAIAHGATGLFYWGLWMGRGQNDQFLDDLKTTLHEITAAAPFLVGDTVEGETTTATPNIRIMQKRSPHGDLWIVLNESPEPKQVELKGKFPGNIAELSGKKLPTADGGTLAFELPGYEVRVFRDGDKPMPEPLYVPKPKREYKIYKSLEGFKQASWVWYPDTNSIAGAMSFFRQEFELDSVPAKAELSVAADDMFRCWVNGELVMEQMGWQDAYTLDVAKYLKPGKNTIRIQAADAGGPPCGLIYAIVSDNGVKVLSGKETEASLNGRDGWKPAQVLAPYGKGAWLSNVSAKPYKPSVQKVPLPKD